MAEGKEVTTGQLFRLEPEALLGYPTLELVREEPVVAASEDCGRHVRPATQRKAALKKRSRRWTGVVGRHQRLENLRRKVMEEVKLLIETGIGVATIAKVASPHGLDLSGVGPPLTCGLARHRNHRVD